MHNSLDCCHYSVFVMLCCFRWKSSSKQMCWGHLSILKFVSFSKNRTTKLAPAFSNNSHSFSLSHKQIRTRSFSHLFLFLVKFIARLSVLNIYIYVCLCVCAFQFCFFVPLELRTCAIRDTYISFSRKKRGEFKWAGLSRCLS